MVLNTYFFSKIVWIPANFFGLKMGLNLSKLFLVKVAHLVIKISALWPLRESPNETNEIEVPNVKSACRVLRWFLWTNARIFLATREGYYVICFCRGVIIEPGNALGANWLFISSLNFSMIFSR